MRISVCETVPARKPAAGKFSMLRCLYERRHRRLHANMEKKLCVEIKIELAELLDEMGDSFLLYEDALPQNSWVRGLLPLPEFDAYLQPKWIRKLLPSAVHDHFVVLGSVPCLKELLCELAPRMKSLLWVAPDLTYQEMLEDFAEDFYQEYGLAINLHFLPVGGTYGQVRIQDNRYSEPVNILDFTEEKYLPVFSPPAGSVWLDMASVYEKERRIEARRLQVRYVSLKKLWEGQPGVNSNTRVDIASGKSAPAS